MYQRARVMQSAWDLGHLHDVTGGSYLEAQPSYPGSHSPKATSSATAAHFKPMPEMLYNQAQYRARYTRAVEELLEGLTQGVSAQFLPITCFLVACGICLYRNICCVELCKRACAHVTHRSRIHFMLQTCTCHMQPQ